ncbi:MAG TPA: lysophospholipid acyltransferase family protein [bacterium]|nr:lysophospholipid acyltransferase family protein [bacterium]
MAAYWGILVLRALACVLPGALVRESGRLAGEGAYFILGRHRRIALKNLKIAFPEQGPRRLHRLARKSFGNLGVSLVESLRLRVFLKGRWRDRFDVAGADILRESLAEGKGAILVLAHLDAWEYLALGARLLGVRTAAIGQDIKNPALDGMVKDTREALGLELFPKYEVAQAIIDYLASGGAVAILADQRARTMSVSVPFFGKKTATTAAPAVLALRSGAPLIPVFIESGKGRFLVRIREAVETEAGGGFKEAVLAVTSRINGILEEEIRSRPEHWLWAHRRWREA